LNEGANGAVRAWRGESGAVARIEALIGPIADDMGLRLVRVRIMSGTPPRLQIMAEREDGTMSVEDCARLSRVLSPALDVEDPISGEYVLEVSSPGLDRPLVRPEDFVRFAGHQARIELTRLLEGRKRFKGRLAGYEGEGASGQVLIEEEGGARVALPFGLVGEAKLVLTDELIAASLKGSLPGLGPGTAPLGDGSEVDLNDLETKRARKTGGPAAKKRERS
jgi:ribosome maturation factor RimP